MFTIIKITSKNVFVVDENQAAVKIPLDEFDFTPVIGDKISIYTTSDDDLVVSKFIPSNSVQTVEENNFSDENGNGVNKTAYVLLAFFLGFIGIHKFYAHHTIAGIFYAIFSWTLIPAVIAFIEMIIAITKPEDKYGNINV
jgi:TM2 domain-containing membrane protein YozV